jgi:outer membrane immunogenic protein
MKKLLVGFAALAALLAGPALAADMPVKVLKTPPVIPYSWTGFYVGWDIGGGWSRHEFNVLGLANFDAMDGTTKFLGGGYAGFNYQFAPWFMIGAEASGNWAAIKMQPTDCTVPGAQTALCTSEVKSLAAVRGRAGIVMERALWYVAAGWGFANVRYDRMFQPPGPIPFTSGVSETRSGFSAASGIEIAISDYLIGRFQYEYFDLGKPIYAVGVLSNTNLVQVKTQVHVFSFGLAYKFGGGPVVAKY